MLDVRRGVIVVLHCRPALAGAGHGGETAAGLPQSGDEGRRPVLVWSRCPWEMAWGRVTCRRPVGVRPDLPLSTRTLGGFRSGPHGVTRAAARLGLFRLGSPISSFLLPCPDPFETFTPRGPLASQREAGVVFCFLRNGGKRTGREGWGSGPRL